MPVRLAVWCAIRRGRLMRCGRVVRRRGGERPGRTFLLVLASAHHLPFSTRFGLEGRLARSHRAEGTAAGPTRGHRDGPATGHATEAATRSGGPAWWAAGPAGPAGWVAGVPARVDDRVELGTQQFGVRAHDGEERVLVGGLPYGHDDHPPLRRAAQATAGQALISLGDSAPVIAILRGLARSAIGSRKVSTPAS